MSDNRKKIKSNLQHSSTTKNLVASVEQLLNDCKKFGAIPFSTMARIAFIGSIMLKSLQKQGYLENSFVENFMNSISSPLSEIQDDMNAVINNKLSKKQSKSILSDTQFNSETGKKISKIKLEKIINELMDEYL